MLYVLVFDLSQPQEQSARELRGWVRSIHSSVSGPVFCLVGTKLDLVDKEDAVAKYVFVLKQLHAYKSQWEEAVKNMLDEKPMYESRHEAESRNELEHRAPAFPDMPSSRADVLCWLVSGVREEADTVRAFTAALVEYIKSTRRTSWRTSRTCTRSGPRSGWQWPTPSRECPGRR